MKKNKVLLVLAILILAMSSLACGNSDELTVDAVVERQTEKVEEGPACEYTFISNDIQHRLQHYRVCNSNGNETKRIKALEKALEDCYELCDNSYESGTDEHVVCVNQCNAE